MNDFNRLMMWSFPIGRMFGIRIRVHWSLLLLAVFEAGNAMQYLPWWMLPAVIVIPFISILLHEFGHSLMARVVGGDSRDITMWMFGGLAHCQVPPTWGKNFIVSAAGPVVTFIIMAICGFSSDFYAHTISKFGFLYPMGHESQAAHIFWTLVAYTANLNLALLLFNLIPATPLDGGSMLKYALWPIVGRARATRVACRIAFVIIPLLLLLALYGGSLFFAVLCIMLLMSCYQEYQWAKMSAQESERSYGIEPIEDNWLAKRQKEKARQQRRKQAETDQAKNQRLDELLEKVSKEGLPSLTKAERKFLQKCSEEERRK